MTGDLPRPPADEDAAARFAEDPFGYVEDVARRLGPLFALPLGDVGGAALPHVPATGDWVFLCRPDLVRAMYEAGEERCSAAEANKVFFGTDEASVAYIDGHAHRRRRRQLLPLIGGRADHSALLESQLAQHARTWPRDTPFPIFRSLQEVTAAVITDVVCGAMADEDRRSIARHLLITESAASTRAEVVAADTAVRDLVASRIPEYRGRGIPRHADVIAQLLGLADDGDPALTDDVVRDEAFSLLYTGFSTTANTLAWAVTRVLDDPVVLADLRAELAERARDVGSGLPYLDGVIRETLRLHPVTALNGVRLLRAPIEIGGWSIPAGAILVHCAHLVQRSARVFADPLEFRPRRFTEGEHDQYAWAAFGGGNHLCVGRGFAMRALRVMLAHLFSGHRFSRTGPIPAAELQGFFMAPADGATVTLHSENGRDVR